MLLLLKIDVGVCAIQPLEIISTQYFWGKELFIQL